MTTVTVTQSPEVAQLKARRAPLQRRLRKAKPRITHEHVAERAKCDRTLVVHYFAGRRSPAEVEAAALELLSERNGSKS